MRKMKWIIKGIVPVCLMAGGQGYAGENCCTQETLLDVNKVSSGNHMYVVITPRAQVRVLYTCQEAPSPAQGVLLSVAAAFTGDDLITVCGDHVEKGLLFKGYDDVTATGHLLSVGGRVKILSNDSLRQSIDEAIREKGCLFQQCYIVENGVSQVNRIPQAILDRRAHIIYRAACVMRNGAFAVVQGIDDQYPEEFVQGLVDMGVQDALYLDMGTWAYGWYRTSCGGPVTELSERFANTAHQSNWLYFGF